MLRVQDATQSARIADDEVIKAFAANGPDQPVPTNNSIRILNTIPSAMLPASLAFEIAKRLDRHS
jgi:hypothetical protein